MVETFPIGMKQINLVFGKGMVVVNTVSRETISSFPLID